MVEDVLQNDFRTKAEPLLYYPLIGPTPDAWVITTPAYVVKTKRAEEIAPEVRALVREVAPSAPMYRVFTMAGLAADSMVELSFTMLTLGIASTLALVLGAVGLFGVLSFVVAERTQEIGVRMALGARAAQVRRMVLSQGARVAALGVVLGAIGAVAATRALGSLLYGVARARPRHLRRDVGGDGGGGAARELAAGAARVERRSHRCAAHRVAVGPYFDAPAWRSTMSPLNDLRNSSGPPAPILPTSSFAIVSRYFFCVPSRSMRAGSVVSSTSKSE